VDLLRKAWNLTMADLGRVMGLSASTVSRRIGSRRGFSRTELERLAEYGGIEEDERWFGGDGYKDA
jgi:transcriptional regulator with XRE-family HTH domain